MMMLISFSSFYSGSRWLLNNKFGKKESKELNNHGTWYGVQASSISLFLNKTEITRNILENKFEKLMLKKSSPMALNHLKCIVIRRWTITYLISWAFSIWRRLVKILISICGTIGHQRVPDYKRDWIICCHML